VTPLSDDERRGILTSVDSAFRRLGNLYVAVRPEYQRFGFHPPSTGVMARDLSEQIEQAIVQHCATFTKGVGHCDLARGTEAWEVKICRSGLTINQSKAVGGENYIVTNYRLSGAPLRPQVDRVFVLWRATDACFSPRRANSNARGLHFERARDQIEWLYPFTNSQLSSRAHEVFTLDGFTRT